MKNKSWLTEELQQRFLTWRATHPARLRGNGRNALALALGITDTQARRLIEFEDMNPVKPPEPQNLKLEPDPSPSAPTITGAKPNDFVISPDDAWQKALRAGEKNLEFERLRANQRIGFPDQPIALCLLSDQHIGANGTDYKQMQHDAEVVARTPGLYGVLTGDAINNFIVQKLIAARVKDALEIDEQWQALKKYLTFFHDENGKSKLIASVSGNHEQWTTKIAGFDMLRGLMPEHVLYDTDQIDVKIQVGAFETSWLFRHKTRYNSVYNALHGAKQTIRLGELDPDVIVTAHIHRGAVYEVLYHQGRKRLGLLTGTYKRFDAYARQEGFGGGGKGNCLTVVISPDGTMQAFDDVKLAADFLEFLRMKWRLR